MTPAHDLRLIEQTINRLSQRDDFDPDRYVVRLSPGLRSYLQAVGKLDVVGPLRLKPGYFAVEIAPESGVRERGR